MEDRLAVTARIRWRGEATSVVGRLAPGFTVANEQVVVRLTDVEPLLDGADGPAVWIPVSDIASPGAIVLRSHMWQIPAGQEREFVLRKLSITISAQIAAGGQWVHLAREMPGTTALIFITQVPLRDATNYLWDFSNSCRYCLSRSMPWYRPEPLTATAELNDGSRTNAAHYASQLPLWLTTRQFWSVFHWEDDRLLHTVQFSLPDKLYRALLRRFRLRAV